jgi:hypothetical protein
MEDPRIERTIVDNIVKEVGREQDSLINEMKSTGFLNKLVNSLGSTIHGSTKKYALDCCRLIISSHSPKITVVDPETKMVRNVRGNEAHVLTGLPSTGKSSWFSIIKSQGLNVIETQVASQGGLLGTPLDQGLTEFLKNSVWLLPEAEGLLSNPTIVWILRSLVEEQEVGKATAYVVSRTRTLKISSSVCMNLVSIPPTAKEYQLLSRFYRVNFEYKNWEEVFDVGEKLVGNLMVNVEEQNSFQPEPRHYFGLIADRILSLGLNDNKFFCYLPDNMKKEVYNTWKNLVLNYYSNNVPKGIALRDLVEGFRASQNYGLLNFFQRNLVKKGSLNLLELTEEDMNHGLQFMESVIKVRSEYDVEQMKETKSGHRIPPKTIVEIYKLKQANPKLSSREIGKTIGVSHTLVSRILKEVGLSE